MTRRGALLPLVLLLPCLARAACPGVTGDGAGGACLVRQGKTAQGVKFYKRALDEDPSPRTRSGVLLELERIQRQK